MCVAHVTRPASTRGPVRRGETLEQVRQSVNLDEMRKEFAGESRVRNTLFSVYVAGPAVESAFNDATSKSTKQN
jgi:hypothetical protein